MAILNQLIRPEEFARLPQDEQEIIKAFVTAGGAVAESFDAGNVRVSDVDSPRTLRPIAPQLKEVLARVEGLQEAKAKMLGKY
jgi:hypothetical protein